MEEKDEPNARGRSLKGKIRTEAKYKGVSPGNLNIKVSYESGYLNVTLGAAQLSGKASQDPYALVYLLSSETGLGLFQMGNNKTRTFRSNLKPDFNTEFKFMVSSSEIIQRNLSLVVAIWDQDTDSRDDYMAGIRVGLGDFPFGPSYDWKRVQLMHQASDGHPSVISVSEIVSPGTQGPVQAPSYPGSKQGTPNKEPRQPTPYPSPQQDLQHVASSPYQQPQQSTPYPSPQQGSPYPKTNYQGTSHNLPYPGVPQGNYPGAPHMAPYLEAQKGSPYPGVQQMAPYPGGQTQSPYPGGPKMAPYPSPNSSNAPYPGGAPPQGSSYPPAKSGSAYPPAK
eukprot:TRINITY_DN23083_c0_g1_i2.p1 TRINITY_DN23083_c0_g1~~TRINITY_DN23083_c0_g1_i2.p1  ORF type:complete len:337 (-),score=63.35 TRINITY_DN23083_c0_g1_i2:83-1093(-)